MYKLIAFATHWGSRYGGINCFNYDLLRAVGTVFNQHVKTICVVTEASDVELRDAEEAFVELVPLPYRPDGNRLSGDTARIVIQELQARNLVSTEDEIVWLGHDRITGEIALSTKNEFGGSTALIHHMSYDHYESFSEDAATAQKKRETQKSLFQQADVRLAVGPLLRDALIDLVHDDTVPMLVPGLASISPCQVPKGFSAILSGRLDPGATKIKQGHLGLAAFARFSRETGGLRPKLVLRGLNYEEKSPPSDYLLPKTEAELKQFAERYAEAAINLHALPYTYDRTQLFRELASSTVAMMPSWHEGFGLVAWEAVAAGVPVILSTDSGVYRLLAEENQLSVPWAVRIQGSNAVPYFTEADVSQLLVHLKTIESNPEKARGTAQKLRTKLLPKYTWAVCAEDLVDSFGWDLRIGRIAVALGPREVINATYVVRETILADEEDKGRDELKNEAVTREIFRLLKRAYHDLDADYVTSMCLRPSAIPSEMEALRRHVREAIGQNDTAAALLLMEQVNELETRNETEAHESVTRLDEDLRSARTRYQDLSIARAETQVAYSSLLFTVGRLDEAIKVCESAIDRLPTTEGHLRKGFASRLRVMINVKGHVARNMKTAREIMFENHRASMPNVFSFNILANKARDYATAWTVLSEMGEAQLKSDVVTFTTLMSKAPDYETARTLLSEMGKARLKPNVVTFNALMSKAPDYETARTLLSEMGGAKIKPDVVTFNTLMSKAPHYETAHTLLSEMGGAKIKPDAVTRKKCNALMSKAPNYDAARALLSEMGKAQLKPDAETFRKLMSKTSDYDTARSLLSEMGEARLKPGVVTFNMLMSKAPDYEAARKLLSEMSKAEIKPDAETFRKLISKVPDYDTARTLLSEMGEAEIKPDVVTFNMLMSKAPDYAAARTLLSEMGEAEIKPDVVAFNTLMSKAPDYDTARTVLSEMGGAEIKPDVVTFNTLLSKAAHYETAHTLLSEMGGAKIKPDAVTRKKCNALMSKAPNYDAARALLSEMGGAEIKPDVVTARTAARYIDSPEQANELMQLLRESNLAGIQFHRAVFSRFCHFMSGEEILQWAFGTGRRTPFLAFDAAVAGFFRLGKIEDALRIASVFPYLDACRRIFRLEPETSKKYLLIRFECDEEPHNAANALAYYHEEQGALNDALHWLEVARGHPETGIDKRHALQKEITRVQAIIEDMQINIE